MLRGGGASSKRRRAVITGSSAYADDDREMRQRFAPLVLARAISSQKSLHRDADHMSNPLRRWRPGEVEQHRQNQCRLARFHELRGRDLAILDREHAGARLRAQIIRDPGYADRGTGLVK